MQENDGCFELNIKKNTRAGLAAGIQALVLKYWDWKKWRQSVYKKCPKLGAP
jgi:hypothetical protein